MQQLSPSQVKAARGLLSWKQEDLAKESGISLTAIRNFEMGNIPRDTTINAVQTAFENSGLEFLDGDGVRRRSDGVRIYQGHDSCDKFFADVLETIKKDGGNVFVSIKAQNILTQPSGPKRQTNLERLEQLRETAPVLCLLSDTIPSALFMSPLEMRTVSAATLGAASCLVYGNKSAQIIPEGRLNFLIIVVTIPSVAHDYRQQLLTQWDTSFVPSARIGQLERRTRAAV